MRTARRILMVLVAITAFPSIAVAAPDTLTQPRAEAAIRAYAASDEPSSISITRCSRVGRAQIRCTLTEENVMWNGEPWNVEERVTAALRHGRLVVHGAMR